MQSAAVRAKLSGEQIPGLSPRAMYMRIYRAGLRMGIFPLKKKWRSINAPRHLRQLDDNFLAGGLIPAA